MSFHPKQYGIPDDFFNTVQTESGIQVEIDDGHIQKAFELINKLDSFRDQNLTINLGVGMLGYVGSIFLGFVFIDKPSDVMALSVIGALAGFFYSSFKRDSEENKIRYRLAQCISGNVNSQSILEKKAKLIQSNSDDVKKVIADNPVRKDHQFYLGGQFNNLERAKLRLLFIIPLTLLLILFILWREFSSIKDAFIIFLCVPFAALGGVFALYFRDIHLSLSAAVGFIALIGIALLNGIVLLTVFNQLREKNVMMSLKDLVIEGTLSRLRPVIMTALVASIGFIPMAVNTGLGSEVQRPLASVVIGGILFSTILTLILFPTVYLYFHESKEKTLK
jgi:multidrug efflux pump subunit AcrB